MQIQISWLLKKRTDLDLHCLQRRVISGSIWWQLPKWFLKNHDFIHVNSTVAGKYNKHKQDGSHLGFPIRIILATVDLQVTSILPMNFESVALSDLEKKFKTDFQDGRYSRNLGFPIATI